MTEPTAVEAPVSEAASIERYRTHALIEDGQAVVRRETMDHPSSACAVRARQLFAVTSIITGAGFDSFSDSAKQIQSDFFDLVSDLALEVMVLSDLAEQTGRSTTRGGCDGQS